MRGSNEIGGDEQELFNLWQQSMRDPGRSAADLAQEVAERVTKFDRTIWWRNFREYAGGAALSVFFVWKLFDPAARGIAVAGLVAVGFVMSYLWRSHRNPVALDPTADPVSYRAALLSRYDCQIRLLSRVKYWYVLPLYAWMLLSILTSIPAQNTGRRVLAVMIATAFSAFVVWLNESYALRKLRVKRKQAEALFQAAEEERL